MRGIKSQLGRAERGRDRRQTTSRNKSPCTAQTITPLSFPKGRWVCLELIAFIYKIVRYSLLITICRLEAANKQLRLQLNVGFHHDAYSEADFVKSQFASRLSKMLKEGASDEEIQEVVRALQERYKGKCLVKFDSINLTR